jgi:protein gp37
VGENSGISWTDNTFNPWMGCVKVSPGCENCYAESFVTGRMKLPVWGPSKTTERKRTSAENWKKPLAWNRAAAKAGKRTRVFCASLADVFEDHPQVAPWRVELFALIEATPHLDWQLLTKRPENLLRMLPQAWLEEPLPHVWLGTTVEDQRRANERIPHLLATPASVRFLSCEPLLEAVSLVQALAPCCEIHDHIGRGSCRGFGSYGIDWVIVGGESGPGARPFDLEWARFIRDECRDYDVSFFCKQLGSNPIMSRRPLMWPTIDRAGADIAEFPEDLRVQQFPEVSRG